MVYLIKKDYAIFDFIERFITEKGYSPTVREIAMATSKNFTTILATLRKLKQARFIDYEEGKPRTIVIQRYSLTEKGRKAIASGALNQHSTKKDRG